MSQDPTELVLRIAAHLKENNALDLATLRRLAKSADDVESIISSAQHLTRIQKHAFSQALSRVITSADSVDWKRVRRMLRQLSVDQRRVESLGRLARKKTAPLWHFQVLKQRILVDGGEAFALEATRVGDDSQKRFLLRIAEGPRQRLLLFEDGKSVAEYPLEPHWTAHIGLTLHRDGETFLPESRLVGSSTCRIVHLERNKIVINKEVKDGWIQPVGLLWHCDKLLFVIAQFSLDGISQIDVASLPNERTEQPIWTTLLLQTTGMRIRWIGAVHAHNDTVRAIVDTNRGVRVCQLFGPLNVSMSSPADRK